MCPFLSGDCPSPGTVASPACGLVVAIFAPDNSVTRVSVPGLVRLFSTPSLRLVLTYRTTLQSTVSFHNSRLSQLMQLDDRPSPSRVSWQRPGSPQGSAIGGCCLFRLPRGPITAPLFQLPLRRLPIQSVVCRTQRFEQNFETGLQDMTSTQSETTDTVL